MLYNQDIYNDLLGYVGAESGMGPTDTDSVILRAMNKALQTIWTKGPYYLRRKKAMAVIKPPVTITIGVTKGSATLTDGSQITDDMIGCMIRIGGEPGDNEIVDATTLMAPLTQPTNATVSAVVYFNSITLDIGVTSVAGNVFLDDTAWELQPYFYEDNQMFKQWPSFPVDPYFILQSALYIRLKVGVPTGYYVVPMQKQVAPNFRNQMKMWPVPNCQHTLSWIQEFMAPNLSLADLEIGEPGEDQPTPTKILPLPGGLHESAWQPLARMAFSSYPHFLEEKRAFVQTESDEAIQYLKDLTPQRQGGAMLRPQVHLPH